MKKGAALASALGSCVSLSDPSNSGEFILFSKCCKRYTQLFPRNTQEVFLMVSSFRGASLLPCGRCCAVLFHLGRWLPAAHSPWRWLRGCRQKPAEGSPGGIGGPGCRPAVLSTASPPRSCRWCGGRRGLAPLEAGGSGPDPGWSWPAEPGMPSPRAAAPPRPPPLAAGGWGGGAFCEAPSSLGPGEPQPRD